MNDTRTESNFLALFDLAVNGDRGAMGTLAADYENLLVAWIRDNDAAGKLTVGANRPSDIVQNFFVRLLRKSPGAENDPPGESDENASIAAAAGAGGEPVLNPVAYFRSGLINEGKTMRSRALAAKRGGGRKATVSTSFFAGLAAKDAATPSQFAIAEEFRDRFVEAFQTFGGRDRVFFVRCVQRTSWEEIGQAEGKSISAVQKRYAKLAVKLMTMADRG